MTMDPKALCSVESLDAYLNQLQNNNIVYLLSCYFCSILLFFSVFERSYLGLPTLARNERYLFLPALHKSLHEKVEVHKRLESGGYICASTKSGLYWGNTTGKWPMSG